MLSFRNQAHSSNRALSITLRGRAGNPTAVGARVAIRLASGSVSTAETYAGGGYLAQSTTALGFGLGRTDRVERVDVRWPNGQKTSHAVEESTSPFTIIQP